MSKSGKTMLMAWFVVLAVSALVLGGCGGGGGGLGLDGQTGLQQGAGVPRDPASASAGVVASTASKEAAEAGSDPDPEAKLREAPAEAKTVLVMPAAAKGERIVDQGQAGRAGTPSYWHEVSGYGINGNMTWTYPNGNATNNYMVWHSGLGGGKYNVQVFIPRNYATTQNARYCVEWFSGDGQWHALNWVSVNQNNLYDAWVDLGTYDFPGEPAVFLSDQTGEDWRTYRKVGFDAVKFVQIGSTPPPPVTDQRILDNLRRAHAMYGKNPYGKFYCLRYVREWSGLPLKGLPSAAAAQKYFINKGVFRATSNPADAPLGAWIFFRWQTYGHVAMRDSDCVMIHQDNSIAGKGRIAHSQTGGLPCTGYVRWEDVLAKW